MPETKIQSKQWTAKGKPASKKKQNLFFGWESDGDCCLGKSWSYFNRLSSKRKNHYRAFDESLPGKLKAEFQEKRPHLQKRKSCFTKTTHRLTPQRLS
ncbi:hypothetical protein TNCV_2321351 [Trichonephila clavipes]|nr:hypothetical protein TNCV_2321351 [Trichonephila clavipes]